MNCLLKLLTKLNKSTVLNQKCYFNFNVDKFNQKCFFNIIENSCNYNNSIFITNKKIKLGYHKKINLVLISNLRYYTKKCFIENNLKEISINNKKTNEKKENLLKIDVDEEMLRYDYEEFEEWTPENTPVKNIDKFKEKLPKHLTERGVNGVYDIDEIVELLKESKAKEIFVIEISKEYNYCQHMVLITATSLRHLKALAEKIKKIYKKKRNNSDPGSVVVEGQNSNDWMAIDLGNIVIHLFMKEKRLELDLEQLWTVGPEYDEQLLKISSEISLGASSLSEFSFEKELEKYRTIRKSS